MTSRDPVALRFASCPALNSKPISPWPARAVAALIAVLLTGCGGDASPSFTVTASLASIKQLTLAWPEPPWAGQASVLEDPDGPGPLPEAERAQVPAALGQATVDIFLPAAVNARYRVALCSGDNCLFSEPLALTGTLEAAMGFIKAEQLVRNASFGRVLALSRNGRVLAVGAIYETPDGSSGQGAPQAGAVHVYERTGAGTWVFRTRLPAPFPDDLDEFGSSLALSADGSVLAVGSPSSDAVGTADAGANNIGQNTGGVHVFRRVANTWQASAFVQGSGASDADRFGTSLDLSDDGRTLAVGAEQNSILSVAQDGKAFVFQESNGVWAEQAVLRSDRLVNRNRFGRSVALSADGDTLVVGAPGDSSAGIGVFPAPLTDDSGLGIGAVHLFQRTGAVWARTAFAKAANNSGAPQFGSAVDISADGQTLLLGAPGADLDANGMPTTAVTNSGAAYVYTAAAGSWVPAALLRAPVPGNSDSFGESVSLSGDGRTAAVGARLQDEAGVGVGSTVPGPRLSDFGAAYAFTLSGSGWGAAVVLKPSDPIAVGGNWFGASVALSGDGRTLAVGANDHDGDGPGIQSDPTRAQTMNTSNSGAVYLY